MNNDATQNDRVILRELAKKYREAANSPHMQTLKKEWLEHNAMQGKRPMVTVEMATFAGDFFPAMLECEGETARYWETYLKSKLMNVETFKDDTHLDDFIGIDAKRWFIPFNLPEKVQHTDGVGHHFITQIEDLEDDQALLARSSFGVDLDATQKKLAHVSELFDGVIPVKQQGFSLCACLTQNVVHVMDMETMFFQMHDYPELFKKMLDNLADDYLDYFKLLSEKGVLLPTFEGQWLGNGANCITQELPREVKQGEHLTAKDIWGFCDSQETVGVSPEMFKELIFPAYKKIMEQYGLASYGCCEPVHAIWDDCLSTLPNLRRASISPWCDEAFMGERLRGTKTIYFRKPSPNLLGVDKVLDEEMLRKHIRKTLDAAKGCKIEFSQRDVYTVHKNPEKVRRYVEIIREESAKSSY